MLRAGFNIVKWSVFLLLFGAVVMFLSFHFRQEIADELGRQLLRPGREDRSDIIFVLGGEPAVRLTYAVELFRKGLGREIWYSATAESENDREFKKRFGFSPGEERIAADAFEKSGLRPDQWRIIPGSISTWSDFQHLREALAARGDSGSATVIVVSYPYHFARAEFCIRRIFGDDSAATFRFAYPSPEEWQARLNDRDDLPLMVLTEYIKLLAYRLKYLGSATLNRFSPARSTSTTARTTPRKRRPAGRCRGTR
jgi:uncharacterized SAM-binding protein YcdF (DUF218 family)